MTNEAAERLLERALQRTWSIPTHGARAKAMMPELDAALAAERKATVERIRAALHERNLRRRSWDIADAWEVLDAEAARERVRIRRVRAR